MRIILYPFSVHGSQGKWCIMPETQKQIAKIGYEIT